MACRCGQNVTVYGGFASPPDPYNCISVASSEFGPIGGLSEPDHPTRPWWYGVTSMAYGRHVQYVYEDLGGGDYQQRIIMETWTGTFVDGETLRRTDMPAGAGSAITLTGYTVRETADGGADQIEVDCETGFPTFTPGAMVTVRWPDNFSTLTPDPGVYGFNTEVDQSGNAVPWGTVCVGQTTGTTGIFVQWASVGVSPGVHIRHILAGPGTTGFAPGETIDLDGIHSFKLANPHGQTAI